MVSTRESKKKKKEEKRRESISGRRGQDRSAGKSERLELAQSRSGAGQEHKLKDGEITSTTPEERRQKEITATAQKGLDIEAERKRLQEPMVTAEPTMIETANADLESGKLKKDRSEGAETIEYETIIQTDETGFQKEVQMPIGTSAKIAEANARREGRVPFNELPAYQQFLAGSIVTSVSPAGLTQGGKFFNSGTKELSKLMKSTFGKYVGQVAVGSGIITWLASDNIIGTMSIYGRDLAEDVKWGATDPEEALRKFDDGMAFVEKGKNFIKTATLLNPLLWPFRAIILANADAATLSLEENRNRILRGGE